MTAAERSRPRAILVVDEWLPAPQNDGASVRMLHLLTLLRSMAWAVTFAPDKHSLVPASDEPLRRLGVEVEAPGNVHEHLAANGHSYEVVLLSRPHIASAHYVAARRHAPQALLVYDTVDLHFLREYRQAKLTGSGRRIERVLKLKRQELALVRATDRTLTVSAVEKEVLDRECPGRDVQVLSNIHDAPGTTRGWEERAGLLFVGNFQHEPNVDAAHFLLDEVWPLVCSRVPGAQLFLVGGNAPPEIRRTAAERVVVTGRVADLHPLYGSCRVSLNPLRFGAGVKGKVLEHMGHGLPVVGSSVAFEGIPVVHGRDALVANSPEEMAAAAARVHGDRKLWERLSANGPGVVREHFSFGAARRALFAVLAPLSEPPERKTIRA